jgi:methylase of polypeptide subunit release factors
MLTYITEGNNKYTVFWENEFNGGGMYFGSEYPKIIHELYPNRVFENCMEWCSGPGFIGYNILDHHLANNLLLVDIHRPALDVARKTKEYNNLNNVRIVETGDISTLPSDIKVDLVVANPPHYDRHNSGDPDQSRISNDLDWKIHESFYASIGKYLTDDGIILIQENEDGSKPEYFYQMISDNNLMVRQVIKSKEHYTTAPTLIYYMEIVKKL